MKRPLCIVSLIITAIVFLYLELFLSKSLDCFPESLDGKREELVGIVADKGAYIDYQGEQVLVVSLIPSAKLKNGYRYIRCFMEKNCDYEPSIGEKVRLCGRIKLFSGTRNPGEFDSRLYYATLKTAYSLKDARVLAYDGKRNGLKEGLYRIRLFLESVLDNCLSSDDSAIMKAILLGDKAFMSEEIKILYKNSGIIHILAVSGVHISILGMGLNKILRKCKISIAPAAIVSAVFMLLYGQMCGMSSSSFRAIVMFLIRLLAPLIGRTYDVLSALSLVELMLLLDQPLYLYNSGFLFSFGAVVGIEFIRPVLDFDITGDTKRMKFVDEPKDGLGKNILKKCVSGMITSMSVLMITLPVYMCFYHTYPVYSIFLNLVVLPVIPFLMILGIGCLFLGSIITILGRIPGLIIHAILSAFKLLCKITTGFSNSTFFLGHAAIWKILLYLIMTGALVFLFEKKKIGNMIIKYASFAFLVSFLIISPRPELKISAIDVGQGDGLLIMSKGANILIDGGSTSNKKVGQYSIIPYLSYEGIGRLDAAIVTHEDEDHISGLLEILDNMEKGGIQVKRLFLPDVSETSRGDNYKMLQKKAESLKIPISYISCGQQISGLGKLQITCLNPEKGMTTEVANAYSTVLFLKYKDFTALLTGDVEKEGQEHILEDIKRNSGMFKDITLLKVAHHGSRYTTDTEFLEMIKPSLAIISCGEGNSYGHPHKELLQRLENTGTRILRTDQSGQISLEINRGKIRIMLYLKESGTVLTYKLECKNGS